MDLTDEQWAVLEPLFPEPAKRVDGCGRPWRGTREVLNGMLWVLRTGAPWRDLPTASIIMVEPMCRTCEIPKQCGSVARTVFPPEVVGAGIYSSITIHGSRVLINAVNILRIYMCLLCICFMHLGFALHAKGAAG